MWLIYALLNPLSESLKGMIARKISSDTEPLLIALFSTMIPALFYLPVLFFIDLNLSSEYWLYFLPTAIINVAANILYMHALREGEISLVVPMLSFTPVFLLVTSPLIVGEYPDITGIAGILLVVAGSYSLNLKRGNKGMLEPFRALLKNRGARYMLIISFLWSFSANFDKAAANVSSMWQHMSLMMIFIASSIAFIAFFQKKIQPAEIKTRFWYLVLIGAFSTATLFLHFKALMMALVAYVVTLKRLTGLMSVFLGVFFLKEKGVKERMTGALIMFAGVVLIVLF